MRVFAALLLLSWGAAAAAASQGFSVSAADASALARLAPGATLLVPGVPDGAGIRHTVRFERITVYAPDARVYADTPEGLQELPRSGRIQLLGDDGAGMRMHLSLDPDGRQARGSGFSPQGAFEVLAEGRNWRVLPAEEALPVGVTLEYPDVVDALPVPVPGQASALDAAIDALALRAGTVSALLALDMDNEFLVKRFGGTGAAQQAAAIDWLADLVGTMNVMYQRDLDAILLQGFVILRTGATPYVISEGGASRTDLDNFGDYWAANHGSVPRAFAALISGRSPSGNSASGIAWVNVYCKKQSYGGSYSINKLFTNPGIALSHSASMLGHELGHNFGARHTHCSSASTGQGPASTNTIDQCYSGEQGCYSGPVSCPTSGPGAPKGTLMSYCHTSGTNCGQSIAQFHPAHVSWVSGRIAANTPSCLVPYAGDLIFEDGFDG